MPKYTTIKRDRHHYLIALDVLGDLWAGVIYVGPTQLDAARETFMLNPVAFTRRI